MQSSGLIYWIGILLTYMKYNEYWHIGKLGVVGTPLKLGLILEHITILNEVWILSISKVVVVPIYLENFQF